MSGWADQQRPSVYSRYTELRKIHSEQAHIIDKVVRKILSLKVTKETIAQIIDNMPIKGNYRGEEDSFMTAHPDIETRSQPSEEATREASELCAGIDPMSLDIDVQAAESFQKEMQKDPQSAASARRCLEIVSSMLHDIASTIYGKRHDPPNVVEERDTPPGCTRPMHDKYCCPVYGRLACATSTWYYTFKHYTSSVAGYWAECMIFGGTVLFARGDTGTECSAAFIHVDDFKELVELTDAQVKSILGLADSGAGQSHNTDGSQSVVLPFTPTDEARCFDIEDAEDEFIYREKGQLGRGKR